MRDTTITRLPTAALSITGALPRVGPSRSVVRDALAGGTTRCPTAVAAPSRVRDRKRRA